MTPLIKAENLYRYYAGHCAVQDVSFTLNKGEVLGFLGPNGAGKTTTMQMLCGNLAPSSGQIQIDGYDILDQPTSAKENLGYLPDTPPLYRDLTVLEFLFYCAQLHHIPSTNQHAAVDKALQRCGLTTVSKRLIANLSKGYKQRIGIAQAILHNPKVIILDEPTVGLDPIQIREIRSLIKELGQEHGIILSTHILSEVQESCSHVQIIHQGRLILHETIEGLNKHMDTATLEVYTGKPVDLKLLSEINGIISIQDFGQNRLHIHHSQSDNPVEAVASFIISRGWELKSLVPIKKSMEDIFIQLTQKNIEANQ